MSMSRKDYQAVASAIKARLTSNMYDGVEKLAYTLALNTIAKDLADVFAAGNENPNRNTFLAACGLPLQVGGRAMPAKHVSAPRSARQPPDVRELGNQFIAESEMFK
jgi:hypothetical protein